MATVLLLLPLLVSPASAKDLNGRFGVGFSQQVAGAGALSAISLKFGLPTGKPTVNFAVEGDVGVNVVGADTTLFAGGRLVYGLVAEDNMNLNLGAAVGYLAEPDEAYIRVQPSLGAEFFLFGLENLGFSADLGVNVDLGTVTNVATVGGAPMVAMHYYF
jgi:hypothetical protein